MMPPGDIWTTYAFILLDIKKILNENNALDLCHFMVVKTLYMENKEKCLTNYTKTFIKQSYGKSMKL